MKVTTPKWLDKDYNVNETLLTHLQNFTHINHNVMEEFEEILLEVNGEGKILIFDSLKDFLHGADIDSNAGSQEAMKIKANEETIRFKSDIVFALQENAD